MGDQTEDVATSTSPTETLDETFIDGSPSDEQEQPPNERIPTARRILIDDKEIPVTIPLDMPIKDIQSALTPLFPHIARSEPIVEIVEVEGLVIEQVSWMKKMGTNGAAQDVEALALALRRLPAETLHVDQEAIPPIINHLLSGRYTVADGLAHKNQILDVEATIDRNARAFGQRGNNEARRVCHFLTLLPSVPLREPIAW